MDQNELNNIYESIELKKGTYNFPVDLSQEAFEILGDEVYKEFIIRERLSSYVYQDNIDLLKRLNPENVFLIEDIKKLCVDFRLRFLDSSQYNSTFPQESVSIIKSLENNLDRNFTNFKLAAPTKCFRLKNCDDDPILFLQLNEEVYYLVHQWGKPISIFRKMMVWPLQNYFNLLITNFTVAILLAILTPLSSDIVSSISHEIFARLSMGVLAFFSLIGIQVFIGFAFFKDVSIRQWNSPFFKSSK